MIKLIRVVALCIGVYSLVLFCAVPRQPEFQAPLFDNLGDYSVSCTSTSVYAVKFFDQGMIMANAFNHHEAARSFREAIRLDSTCAMAYWGIAYVLGPNYNTASNLGELNEIRDAVEKAVRYSEQAEPWEKALINAIQVKFPADKSESDSEAYARVMKENYEQFPDNDLIATLYAESIMNLHAWDLYTKKGGEPKPWTPELVGVLEKAMSINPDNPLANHLYLHAVEAAPDVEKGLTSANRLKKLVPGAGHLVHMPSHIYINTGDYHEGSLANEEAVIQDSIYIAECQVKGVYPQMYYPHNYHFLAATAALEGRGARSIEAAFKMTQIVEEVYLEEPGFETTQHYITIPYNVLVKFAQWEKILTLPSPKASLPYPRTIWHYARGMAFANTGKLDKAREELVSLQASAAEEAVESIMIWEINTARDVCTIADYVLQGEIKRKEGKTAEAELLWLKAIAAEDGLNYNEPPEWFFSVRHLLGDLYVSVGAFEKAEKVFREDLATFPKNGFALNGLYHSLVGMKREAEAQVVKKQFEEAWKYADSTLKYALIDETKRENLTLRISEDSPATILYIAGNTCGFN